MLHFDLVSFAQAPIEVGELETVTSPFFRSVHRVADDSLRRRGGRCGELRREARLGIGDSSSRQ